MLTRTSTSYKRTLKGPAVSADTSAPKLLFPTRFAGAVAWRCCVPKAAVGGVYFLVRNEKEPVPTAAELLAEYDYYVAPGGTVIDGAAKGTAVYVLAETGTVALVGKELCEG